MQAVYDGYGRVSSVGGREGDGYISPKEQEKKDRRWAKEKGYKFGIFEIDEDVSGATERRPKLDLLIGRVERGESAGIICPRLDRFGRNVEQIIRNYRRVKDAGGVVVFVDEGMDPTTPTGEMLFIVLAALAQFQWQMAQAGFLTARTNAVGRGIHVSRYVPTGYLKDPDTRILSVDPVYGPYVTEAFTLAADGMAKCDIATLLNAKGGDKHWSTSWLSDLLANRVYLGEARSGDIVNEGAHPALTDPATFAAAQANKRIGPYGKTEALLQGLIRCAGCRRTMHIGWQKVPKGEEKSFAKHATYGCTGKNNAGQCKHQAAIKATDVEAAVLDWFWEVADDKALTGAVDTADLARAEGELVEAEAERKAVQSNAKLSKLGDAFVEMLEERIAIEEAARATVAQVRGELAHPELGDVTSLRSIWDTLEPSERHELVSSVLGAVYVRKAAKKGHRVEGVEDRCMIFPKGDQPESPRRGAGKPFPILPLVFD